MAKMLTTIDNPFNPFTDFDNWYAFDVQKGYNTCSYLARIAVTTDAFGKEIEEIELEKAMEEIAKLNLSGNHIIVEENDQTQ